MHFSRSGNEISFFIYNAIRTSSSLIFSLFLQQIYLHGISY
jgi:hypothetical protein